MTAHRANRGLRSGRWMSTGRSAHKALPGCPGNTTHLHVYVLRDVRNPFTGLSWGSNEIMCTKVSSSVPGT